MVVSVLYLCLRKFHFQTQCSVSRRSSLIWTYSLEFQQTHFNILLFPQRNRSFYWVIQWALFRSNPAVKLGVLYSTTQGTISALTTGRQAVVNKMPWLHHRRSHRAVVLYCVAPGLQVYFSSVSNMKPQAEHALLRPAGRLTTAGFSEMTFLPTHLQRHSV